MTNRNRTPLRWMLAAALAMLALLLMPLSVPAQGMEPLSTGIGLDNREAHPDYPLKLVFAANDGPYLAAIDVEVYDSAGDQVLKTHSQGPWLFVDLPAGEYRVKAMRQNGDVSSAMVNVPGDGQATATLTWRVG